MSNDPAVRRIMPQDTQPSQQSQMSAFSFAPNQYPPQQQQRETQKSKRSASPARLAVPIVAIAPANLTCY